MAETARAKKVVVSVTIDPEALDAIDAARGSVPRSPFLEIGGLILCDLMELDRRSGARDIKYSREWLRTLLRETAKTESKEEPA